MYVARIVLALVAAALTLGAVSLSAQEPQGTRRPKLVITETAGKVTTLQPTAGFNDGTDDGSAARGKDVFASAGCGAAIGQWGSLNACGVATSTCNPCSAHAYLQFSTADLPAADIASAQIQVYFLVSHWNCGRAWPQDPVFGMRRVTGSWDEMTLDWNNQPTVDAALIASQTFTGVAGLTPVTAYTWLTYDITDLYRQWVSGAVPNHGVRISHENAFCFNCDSAGFFSSDDGRTEITYSGPTAGEPGAPVTVSATVVEAGAAGIAGRTLSFAIGTQACSATTDATGYASCLLAPEGAGAQTLTVSFEGDAQFQASSRAATFQVGAAPPASPQGLWWNAPAGSESGWGINFAHQGNIIFATWFTYGEDGAPWWLAMVAEQAAPNVYHGDLFTTTGPPFGSNVPPPA